MYIVFQTVQLVKCLHVKNLVHVLAITIHVSTTTGWSEVLRKVERFHLET